MSMQEIRRLSDELRSTIKANEIESASQKEAIESLQGQVATHLKVSPRTGGLFSYMDSVFAHGC